MKLTHYFWGCTFTQAISIYYDINKINPHKKSQVPTWVTWKSWENLLLSKFYYLTHARDWEGNVKQTANQQGSHST